MQGNRTGILLYWDGQTLRPGLEALLGHLKIIFVVITPNRIISVMIYEVKSGMPLAPAGVLLVGIAYPKGCLFIEGSGGDL